MANDPGSPDMTSRADYWAQRLADGSDAISDAERSEFNAWLFASEENQREFQLAVMVSQMPADLSASQQSTLISLSSDQPSESDRVAGRRNILKFTALAASAAATLVTGGLLLENLGSFGQTHRTATAETQTVRFSDGSVAYLNTRTELRWRGKGNERVVELVAGEALFDVVHDKARPFVVQLAGSESRVLGTRFNVYRKSSGDVVLTVLEGTVEARGFGRGGANPEWVRKVHANEQMEYRPIGLVGEPQRTDPLVAVMWRDGWFQLPVKGAPLPAVLDELTRYTDKSIVIRDTRLAKLNVSGAIYTRDVKTALRNLQTSLPVSIRETESTYALDYRDPGKERN
jgi:transmembrane sensor